MIKLIKLVIHIILNGTGAIKSEEAQGVDETLDGT